jgi:hypothetical protein
LFILLKNNKKANFLLQGIKGDAEDLAISMLNDTTSKLTSAVSSLPELLEKKRLLDSHTNIATALLDHIKVNIYIYK